MYRVLPWLGTPHGYPGESAVTTGGVSFTKPLRRQGEWLVTSLRCRGSWWYDPTDARGVTMDEREWLGERFEEQRTHLRAVAYRMLGSLSEADDAVQEAWLRLSRSNASEIQNLGGWLTTVVARVSLNMLRSRKTRREQTLAVHIPDPI